MGDDFLGAALHADSAFSETIDKLRDVDRYFARRPPVAPASSDAGPGSADEQAGETKKSEQQSEQQSEVAAAGLLTVVRYLLAILM